VVLKLSAQVVQQMDIAMREDILHVIRGMRLILGDAYFQVKLITSL